MREKICRGLLALLEKHTPAWIAALEIQILLCATARAFGRKGQAVRLRDPGRALSSYAAFTRKCLQESPARPKEIYREAWRLGNTLRRLTGFTRAEDLQRLVFYLYRNIGIDMAGDLPGEIRVSRCFFSRFYTPGDCARMSWMDAGVIAGICGSGRLVFTERLTNGCSRCRACFTQKGPAGAKEGRT